MKTNVNFTHAAKGIPAYRESCYSSDPSQSLKEEVMHLLAKITASHFVGNNGACFTHVV